MRERERERKREREREREMKVYRDTSEYDSVLPGFRVDVNNEIVK
jgi:hypothetical protein